MNESKMLLLDDNELSDYVFGKFFVCITPFLPWLKQGESYWLEYHGNNTYEVRSDNEFGRKFQMSIEQLLNCFVSSKKFDELTTVLSEWFYGVRTWGLLGNESNEDFCKRHAIEAAAEIYNMLKE